MKEELISIIFFFLLAGRGYLNHHGRQLNGLSGHYAFELHQQRTVKEQNGSSTTKRRVDSFADKLPLDWEYFKMARITSDYRSVQTAYKTVCLISLVSGATAFAATILFSVTLISLSPDAGNRTMQEKSFNTFLPRKLIFFF